MGLEQDGVCFTGPRGSSQLNLDEDGSVEGFSAEGHLSTWEGSSRGEAGTAYFDIGGFPDAEAGHSYGMRGGLRSIGEERALGESGFYAYREGPSVGAELVFGERQTRIGAGATSGGGGMGFRSQDPASGGDIDARMGVSEGPGAGVRFHHRDADGDGRQERGMGVDLGFVSADLIVESSEDMAVLGTGLPGLRGVARRRGIDRPGTLARVAAQARQTVDRKLQKQAVNEVCSPCAE
jgi:hypothetical protein